VGPAAELVNIHKRFGEQIAVEDLSLSVMPGEVFGFLGPNGAGKTTALRILLDIIAPDRGCRSVLGASSALAVSHRIGYLPEERGLYKNMSAVGVMAYLARLKGVPAGEAKSRAHALLERYGLGGAAKKRVKQLSKGMAQKVQVLSTLVHEPELLILDEPFSGLDPVNQQVLEELLADVKAQGRTIIFSTHVMQHAERLCDRITLIASGRDAYSGTVGEAKRLLDGRVRLRTADDVSLLREVPGVKECRPIDEEDNVVEWEIVAERDLSIERLLAACIHNEIVLVHFTTIEPSLHEVFVHLVGAEAARQLRESV